MLATQSLKALGDGSHINFHFILFICVKLVWYICSANGFENDNGYFYEISEPVIEISRGLVVRYIKLDKLFSVEWINTRKK